MIPPELFKMQSDLDYSAHRLKQSTEKLIRLRQQHQYIAEQIASEEQRFLDINRLLISQSGELFNFLNDIEKELK